jgi:hypothetical protein
MVYFREPAGAVLAALEVVEGLSTAKLPPGHLGVAAGPVWGRAATTLAAPSIWPPETQPTPNLPGPGQRQCGRGGLARGRVTCGGGGGAAQGVSASGSSKTPTRYPSSSTRPPSTECDGEGSYCGPHFRTARLIRHAGTGGVLLHEVISIVERSGVAARERVVQALPLRLGRTDSLRLTLTARRCGLGSGWSSGEAEPWSAAPRVRA